MELLFLEVYIGGITLLQGLYEINEDIVIAWKKENSLVPEEHVVQLVFLHTVTFL